jgi:hypothetical protein
MSANNGFGSQTPANHGYRSALVPSMDAAAGFGPVDGKLRISSTESCICGCSQVSRCEIQAPDRL